MDLKKIQLSNGRELPNISYGTGVIRRYYRNKKLFLRDTYLHLRGSIKKRKIEKKLLMDWGG